MDVHVMDVGYNVIGLLENYDSLIWTERYSEAGDFSLKLSKTKIDVAMLNKAFFVRIPSSDRTMLVESIEEDDTVTVSGHSLEYLLERRVIEYAGATRYNNLPDLIVQLVLNNIGALATVPERRIPYFNFAPNDIEGYVDSAIGYDPVKYGENLYTAVTRLCLAGNLGFKIVNPPETVFTDFNVYYGKDRTTTRTAVIFSESIGNIEELTRFRSDVAYKNVAVVNLPPWDDTPGIGELWRVTNDKTTPSGFNRREVWTEASELRRDDSFTALNKPPRAKAWGAIELKSHPSVDDIDFKMAYSNPYRYNEDYALGDIVTVIDSAGESRSHRVTEYIQSFGPEGDAEYPTLSAV